MQRGLKVSRIWSPPNIPVNDYSEGLKTLLVPEPGRNNLDHSWSIIDGTREI